MKYSSIFFTVLILISCNNRKSVPSDIIPRDSMTVIMKDIIMVNEYALAQVAKDTLKKDKILANQELLEGVFKIHRISRETFQNSLRFYESRPDMNKVIFDSLSAYANRHRTELYQPMKIPKGVQQIAK